MTLVNRILSLVGALPSDDEEFSKPAPPPESATAPDVPEADDADAE
jgi:hypothetical protein